MKNEVGEVRPGQFITTYGPGAVMDAVNDSIMILDITHWNQNLEPIHDKRLAGFLKKDLFKKLPVKGKRDLPAIPFPSYHVCSNVKCRNLFDISQDFEIDLYLKNGPTCPKCSKKSYPSRFILSCRDGNHLDDFPWQWWTHKKKGNTGCNGELKLSSSGNNSGLSSMTVSCVKCGAFNDMGSATQESSFKDLYCSSYHPHTMQRDTSYEKHGVIPLQRGASNVYFPVLRSAISIPENENPKQAIFVEYEHDLEEEIKYYGDRALKVTYERRIEQLKIFNSYEDFLENWEFFKKTSLNSSEEINKYEQIKEIEYEAFTKFKGSGVEKGNDFKAEVEIVPDELKKYFNRIVKAQRLKEILVLLGFTRIDSPEPEVKDVQNMVKLGKANTNWLPAVEIFGEGIFIELNRDTLEEWLNKNRDVFYRSNKYKAMYQNYVDRKGWTKQSEKDAIYVLLHTFAHLLMKQLSLQSGYSSAAIKERIYYNANMAGILLYTGSTDQEGSLGGLVEMGEINKLRKILIESLDEARFCSNDPSCSIQEPTDENYINGASCFACTMLPETSCETGNMLLDRSLLVKTMESEISPFFEGLI